MRRMALLRVQTVALAFIVPFAGAACSRSAPASRGAGPEARTNILLIVADDLGYADTGPYGSDIRTPNLDRLAAEGILFTNFHTAPMCAPTRAMLLTGNNNHVAGMGQQSPGPALARIPGYEGHLSERVAPFPRLLRAAGYHTYTAGKWHLGDAPEHSPPAAGFERSWQLTHGAANHFNAVGFTPAGSLYREDGLEVEYPAGTYTTELFTDRLIGFIESNVDGGQPFFAFAAYTSPHWPLQVPDEWLHRYTGRYDDGYDALRTRNFERLKARGIVPPHATLPPRNPAITPWDSLDADERRIESRRMELYAAMVENLDHHIGRLIDVLKQRGVYDNTLVVFMSDNGAAGTEFFYQVPAIVDFIRAHYDNSYENMGRPNSWVSYGAPWAAAGAAPFSGTKTHTLEGGIAAQLIIAGPRVAGRGTINRAYATVMDLAPTFLEVAGATYPDDGSVRPMEGESMAALLAGDAATVHADDYVTTFFHAGRAFVRRDRWKLVTLEPPFDESAFVLYDLDADPGETTDLSAEFPEVRRELLELWRTERARLGIILPDERPGE